MIRFHALKTSNGIVLEALPGATFKVELDNGQEILAYVSGKMRLHHIKILPGDKVMVEFAALEDNRGRIIRRF